jgi:5-methylcytosine-specific restriction protein A
MADEIFKLSGRKNDEWIGKTPDSRPPKSVVDRIFLRQMGRDAITGQKMGPKDIKHVDHILPLKDGGENRESNLQIILLDTHKDKTSAENSARKKERRQRLKHQGLWPKTRTPLRSRGFPKRHDNDEEDT